MNLSKRIFSWLILALLGLGTSGAILSSYLPQAVDGSDRPVATSRIFIYLYVGIFAFIFGLGTLVGYAWRWGGQKTISNNHHWPVVRQSALVATGLLAALVLQGFHVLSWWDAVLLVVALLLVELSFRTKVTS